MSTSSLFISYGRGDLVPTNWLERLKLYLAPLRREGVVDIWDDTRIPSGSQWREQIAQAIETSTASILLVGPAFLASDFIATQELPKLLGAAKTRGASIYPVVVGYCAYKNSVLEPYQAFNDPEHPLEAIPAAEQNKILNDVSLTVDNDLRHAVIPGGASFMRVTDTRDALRRIAKELDKTATAFKAQCSRRDPLVATIKSRLNVTGHMQYENFFFRYYGQLTDVEKFQFEQIRGMTEGLLYNGNRAILQIIEAHPQVLDEVPSLLDLRQHVVFWLNKYEKVFVSRPEMCLLYTGVEDGVPFPEHADEDVDQWLKANE